MSNTRFGRGEQQCSSLSHFHTFTQNSIFIFRFFLILPAKCRNLSLSRPKICPIHIFFVPLHPIWVHNTQRACTIRCSFLGILSTPISFVERVRGIHYILKRRLLTLCCWQIKSFANFYQFRPSQSTQLNAYGYDDKYSSCYLGRRVVISA